MTDYRVDIKVRNNNILRKIEEAGYSSVGEFCRLNNMMSRAGTIGEFVNLKRSPLDSKGQFLQVIEKMCDILLCSPEDLFSEVQLTTALESNRRSLEVNEAEMQFMLESHSEPLLLEDQISQERLPVKIELMLSTLTPREAKVIKLRYGLDDCAPQTLEEVATQFDSSRERIRQIEAKALRKLRHPSRSERVREYIEEAL